MSDFSLLEQTRDAAKELGLPLVACPRPEAEAGAANVSFRVGPDVMLAWSRTSERIVLWRSLADAEIHAGFECFSRLRPVVGRYRKLVRCASVWVYGEPDVEPDLDGAHVVDVAGTPLEREWFVLVRSPEHHALLVARDDTGPTDRPAPRRSFDGVMSRSPALVDRVHGTLRAWAEARLGS